ncbi:non-ribosomal peptide synthetase [Micromonospora echinofusca]|uniref:Amino acid adenylation domain-containing protein n=1 Tax=Micromonospora echinofusca TaxID=47858 RepID=A0ABS3VNT2_MICEH|nr:non-ribosomal peptide synthetase [Micromonospora echinofusca]MBO4206029.1 amino acid adenylation domain-containing protein [Micromonospora echinofusca]
MKATAIQDVYELTPLQQGLLFHCLQAPSAGFYVEQMHFTMRGELRVDVIRAAWKAIIARHPGLRTSFSWEDINRPVQIVHRSATLPCDEIDLSGYPADERERRFTAYLLAERRCGFDLESAPLLRLTVFRFDADTFRLAWRFSHLIMDGWSFGLIMSDFVQLYKAIYHGREITLPTPNGPSDYVSWWRRQDQDAARAYWTEALAGHQPPAPLDLGDPPGGDLAGADPGGDGWDPVRHGYVALELGELANRLRDFSRSRRLTLNTLVQGAWTLVLSRCYGEPDVTVGATMSHRPAELPGCESIVGPLIVTLPVRVPVEESRPVEEWLHTVQSGVMGARDHAGAPLPVIRGWADAPRSADLFETIVSYENVPIPDISFADENMELLGYDVDGRPQYPMSLIVLPGDEIPLRLIFDRRRFTTTSARRMLARVRTTLAAFADGPDRRLGDVDVVPVEERNEILALAVRAETVPADESLPAVVRAQAARLPEKVALVGDGSSVTFAELTTGADRVAAALRAAGVRPGDRVAICADRTPRLVVGLLGILSAGAAYVPLDPTHPPGRHAFVLDDSASAAVLTESAVAPATDLPVVLLDGDLPEPVEPVDVAPDDIAYVMYTSGSTGEPKGVQVTHRNVLRLVRGGQAELDLGEDDVWAMFFSPAFDGATYELWGSLATGARLVVVPHAVSRSPEDLLALLAGERVTVCTMTPSAFRQLISVEPTVDQQLSLRVQVLGGEKVDPSTLAGWFERHPDRPWVVNAYGPTEATVWVCHHRVLPEESTQESPRSLIGRALPDTAIYPLDASGRLAPLGAPGELHLAGPGVTAGYVNRPEENARRFVPDRFTDGGTRMYASGDLGRFTATGELEYLGRADGQVKVRGYRVEPGEVATRLRSHPGVRTAVAVVRGEQLFGYVVPTGEPVPGEELVRHCAQVLPEYMVPTSVTTIEEIPLTPNGKLDHRALPDAERPSGGTDYVAPRGPTELRLAEILAEVLGVARIGVHDDLQELGLHSLLATRAVNAIRASWQVNIPLRRLFETPTIAAVAEIIHGGGAPRLESDRPGQADLATEAVLDADLVEAISTASDRSGRTRHVFVTGATGFPGAYLVAELARTTDATVHCLVRAADPGTASARLRDHLRTLQLWSDDLADRVHAVPGDLAQPFLGLSREEFDRHAEQADQIFHFGAYVNFLYPYRRLRSVNVAGTKEIIRLATTGRKSVLHHVSSVGVFAARRATDGDSRGAETELDPSAPRLPNGYAETKWVAERLVTQARDAGLPVVIHRLGRVAGDSRTGVWRATNDALAELLKASAGLGALPRFEGRLDMVPVDHVARAMAAIATRPEALGRIFHLVNPRPLVFEDLRAGFERAGYPPDSREMIRWYTDLVDRSATTDEDWSVAIALLAEWTQHASHGMRDPRFDSGATQEFLAGIADCPPVDADVLGRYLRYLADVGFLRRPAVAHSEVS